MTETAWEKFKKSLLRKRAGKSYEPLEPNPSEALSFYNLDVESPGRLMLFTKAYLLGQWFDVAPLPPGAVALVRSGTPTRMNIDVVRRLILPWALTIGFIGDLDPMDLTVFAAWRCADPTLRSSRDTLMPMRWAGVDDDWLKLCEANLPRGKSMQSLLIRMSPVERRHFAFIDAYFGAELPTMVGHRCLKLLRAGLKLEIEGASNPALYRKGFATRLHRHLAT